MVSVAQIRNGLSKYIDNEFLFKINGWQKWVFGALAGIALLRVDEIFNALKGNEFVKMLGVIDDFDNVDLDVLYREFSAQAQKGAITFSAPVIGPVTLNSADVDKIYRYIKED